MFFFIIYIIAILLFGSTMIGPLSIRVYSVIIMILFLIIQSIKGEKTPLPIKYIIWYVLFVVLMGVAFISNGEFKEYGFLKFIFANHLVCVVTYFAIGYFLTNPRRIRTVTIVLLVIMCFTSVITLLQYNNIPLGWALANVFSSNDTMSESTETLVSRFSSETNMLGHSLSMGVFKYSFDNAMYIASTALMSLYWVFNQEKVGLRVLCILIYVLGLIACFYTQQRAAFYCLIIMSLIVLLKKIRTPIARVMVIVAVSSFFIFKGVDTYISDNESLGRLSMVGDFEDDARYDMWERAYDFIVNNIDGGPLAFSAVNDGMPAHNFFFNAFIYGGWIGGFVIVFLFFSMVIEIFKVIFRSSSVSITYLYALCLLSYFICGMVHNASLVYGSVQIFILFPIVIYESVFKKQQLLLGKSSENN